MDVAARLYPLLLQSITLTLSMVKPQRLYVCKET
jgi:hypothetical protein